MRSSWPDWAGPPPAVSTRRNRERRTYGNGVATLAEICGRPFMPWQMWVADVALEVDDDGHFVYKAVDVTVPRQSGKTVLDGFIMLERVARIARASVWFTMQTGKDARDWLMNNYWPLVSPLGPSRVHLRRAAGTEWVEWLRTNGLVRPFSPTPDNLHGKTTDLVVVDEAWAFDQMKGRALDQAIVPTQATKPDAQVWKVSTAGDASSTWWLGSVEAGRAAVEADRTEGRAYFEWSCPDELDPCDPASWPIFHPAYGRTIGDEAMRAALDLLGPDDFARAYGNRWVSTLSRVIPLGAWRAAHEEPADLPEPSRMALAFDVAVDRSDAAIVVAWRDSTGVCHVEVADHREGTGWLADRLVELAERWRPCALAFDAAGPALDVADAVRRAGLELEGLGAKDYAAACAGLLEALCAPEPTIRVRGHPALDSAASAAVRRALGDAWAWGRRQSTESIAALTAATVAVWAYDHAPAGAGDFRVF